MKALIAMKNIAYIIPLLLLLASCGSLQETTSVADDVYDIPDRQAMAAKAAAERPAQEQGTSDDYYDPAESARANSASEEYYNMTYNDPYYYNYGRFGFGTGIGSYGPSIGMSMSYGWPTSFGSMGIGYSTGYGAGYGYNPYWGNSWMSGYGYSPYGFNPYGYYGYGNYGYGYGGYGMGYGPYQGPWGGCYGCYEPYGYGNVVYSHRPSMSSGSMNTSTPGAPRMMRNPASLMPDANPLRRPAADPGRSTTTRPDRIAAPTTPSRTNTREPARRPSRTWDSGTTAPAPSRSGGGNTGGGISSPRPR
ncbi:MAG: hypothetical protein WBB32_00590 [Flavobacteriales bacterium]